MESKLYEVDPNGDTLLTLHNANAPFAVVPSPAPQEGKGEEEEEKKEDGEQKEADTKPTGEAQDAEAKPAVRLRLSSKHLALASKYFQKMTANDWKEMSGKSDSSYAISMDAHDWDEDALLIVMNIIHGRTAKVPRTMTLEKLAKVAVVVDYYQCHDAVDFFAQTWLSSVSDLGIPKEGERHFMLRLVVALVFRENTNFTLLTKNIIRGNKGPIDALGLPIPEELIDQLNLEREFLVEGLISDLFVLRRRLYEDTSCTFECSSIYTGALMKGMHSMGILDPVPDSPYPGHSLATLEKGIRSIKEPDWRSNCLTRNTPDQPEPEMRRKIAKLPARAAPAASPPVIFPTSPCNLAAKTAPILERRFGVFFEGLSLSDYVRR